MKTIVTYLIISLLFLNPQITLARSGSGGHGGGGHGGGHSSGSSSASHTSGRHSSGGHTSRSYSSGHSGRSSSRSYPGISRHSYTSRTHYSGGTYKSGYAIIERSETAKHQFLRQHGMTKTPPGMHIDHIRPLSQGGSDTPSNMQLLSVEAHHTKTAAERRHY